MLKKKNLQFYLFFINDILSFKFIVEMKRLSCYFHSNPYKLYHGGDGKVIFETCGQLLVIAEIHQK